MNPLVFILSLLEKLPPLLSATTRLVRATKASEPPLPVDQGAEAYLKGANDEAFRQEQRNRIRWKMEQALEDEPAQEEKPQ